MHALRALHQNRRISPMDRELAVSQLLGDGLTPRRDGQHLAEQTVGRVSQRLRLVHDSADIDVDVVGHLPRRAAVAGDFDHGRDWIAGGRAEAGGEDDDLRAAADHAGHRLDVEARCIHHRQPLASDPRGVGHHILERRPFSAFVCRP